jgi:hypothetical protein
MTVAHPEEAQAQLLVRGLLLGQAGRTTEGYWWMLPGQTQGRRRRTVLAVKRNGSGTACESQEILEPLFVQLTS